MAHYLKFTVIACMEYAAALFLMASIFKLHDRGNLLKLAALCLLTSQVTYMMCLHAPRELIPLTTVSVWLIYMRLLFPLRWFHAAIVTVHTYLFFGLIQGTLMLASLALSGESGLTSMTVDVVSLLSVVIVIALACYIRRRNWGLSFVPEERKNAAVHDPIDMKLVIGMLVAMISFLGNYTLTVTHWNTESFLASILLMLPTLGLLVYLLWQKEIQKYASRIPTILPKR